MKLINELGNSYGSLTIIGLHTVNNKHIWLCECSCGKRVNRFGWELRGPSSKKHCGCEHKLKSERYIGKRFGKLTVLDTADKTKYGRPQQKCMCDCGNIIVISNRNLQRGASTHCGCSLNTVNLGLPEGRSILNKIVGTYKNNAKIKGLDFELTTEECESIFSKNCHYCNSPPRIHTYKKLKGEYYANGIDRVDSSIGYVFKNCVTCCSQCNYMKGSLSYDYFTQWVLTVADNMFSKQQKEKVFQYE